MPEFVVEFEVFCTCGEGLCPGSTGGNTPRRNQPFVTVEPCPVCLEKARDKAEEEGYDRGVADNED